MTEPKGAAWRQTIYYPCYFASRYGRGTALQLAVKSPGYDAEVADNVPYLDISAVHDEEGETLTFFAVNRHGGEALGVEIGLQGFGPAKILDCQGIESADLEAVDSLKNPDAVTPKKEARASVDRNALAARLPPHSYHMIRVSVGPA
jgi:alpha-L-arabinofuranosidase